MKIKRPDIPVTIIIALACAWLGAYIGYRYAFHISEVHNDQRLQLEIKAVINELKIHASMIKPEEALKALKDEYVLTGEPFKTDALTHFIESGDYLETKNDELIKKLVSLNQWYARTNMSGERYNNFTWGFGVALSNRHELMQDIGSAWIVDCENLKQQIEEIVPLLKSLIELGSHPKY